MGEPESHCTCFRTCSRVLVALVGQLKEIWLEFVHGVPPLLVLSTARVGTVHTIPTMNYLLESVHAGTDNQKLLEA